MLDNIYSVAKFDTNVQSVRALPENDVASDNSSLAGNCTSTVELTARWFKMSREQSSPHLVSYLSHLFMSYYCPARKLSLALNAFKYLSSSLWQKSYSSESSFLPPDEEIYAIDTENYVLSSGPKRYSDYRKISTRVQQLSPHY
jgi:hypothetical protein